MTPRSVVSHARPPFNLNRGGGDCALSGAATTDLHHAFSDESLGSGCIHVPLSFVSKEVCSCSASTQSLMYGSERSNTAPGAVIGELSLNRRSKHAEHQSRHGSVLAEFLVDVGADCFQRVNATRFRRERSQCRDHGSSALVGGESGKPQSPHRGGIGYVWWSGARSHIPDKQSTCGENSDFHRTPLVMMRKASPAIPIAISGMLGPSNPPTNSSTATTANTVRIPLPLPCSSSSSLSLTERQPFFCRCDKARANPTNKQAPYRSTDCVGALDA